MKFLNKVLFFVIALTLNIFASTPTGQSTVSQFPREIRNIIEKVLDNEKVKSSLSSIVNATDPQSDALAEQFRNAFKDALVSVMDKNVSTLNVSDRVYDGEFDNEVWDMAKSIKDGFIENYQESGEDFDQALRKTFNQSVSAADFILKNSSTGDIFDKFSDFVDFIKSAFNKAFSKSLIKDDVTTIYNDEELNRLSEDLARKLVEKDELAKKTGEKDYGLNESSGLSDFERDIDNFTSKFKSVFKKDQAMFEKAFSDPDFATNFAKAILDNGVAPMDYRSKVDFIRDYVTKAVTKTLLKEKYGITDSNTNIEGYIKSLQPDPSAPVRPAPTQRNNFKDAYLELKSEIKPSELDKLSRAELDKLGITDADAYIYKEPDGDVFIGFKAKFFDDGLKVYKVVNGTLERVLDNNPVVKTMADDLEGSRESTHYIGTSYDTTIFSDRARGMDYSYHLNTLDDDVRPVEGI